MPNPGEPVFRLDRPDELGPQAAPPLFFDDREENVKAARAFGWEAVQSRGSRT